MQPARPAPRRSFHFAGASHWLLAALAAPLFAAFAWQHGFASVGDDSVSYIVVARWLAGGAGPLVSPWVPLHTHFPPLFPLVLAATGTDDLLAAHLAVAAFAALSVGFLSRYAAHRLGTSPAGVAVAIAFLLLPTAWIGAKGVLSETLFLAITLAALLLHDSRASRGETGWRSHLALGLLLAAAMLTRTLGAMLVAAYVARALVEWMAGRDRRPAAWLPLLPVAVLVGAWMAVRPGGQGYGFTPAAGSPPSWRSPRSATCLARCSTCSARQPSGVPCARRRTTAWTGGTCCSPWL